MAHERISDAIKNERDEREVHAGRDVKGASDHLQAIIPQQSRGRKQGNGGWDSADDDKLFYSRQIAFGNVEKENSCGDSDHRLERGGLRRVRVVLLLEWQMLRVPAHQYDPNQRVEHRPTFFSFPSIEQLVLMVQAP